MKRSYTIVAALVLGASALGAYTMRPTARIERAAKAAVLATLKDPGSATFGRFHILTSVPGEGAVCGTVNAKNGFGGLTGATPFFVMEGAAFFPSQLGTMGSENDSYMAAILDRCQAESAG